MAIVLKPNCVLKSAREHPKNPKQSKNRNLDSILRNSDSFYIYDQKLTWAYTAAYFHCLFPPDLLVKNFVALLLFSKV